MRTLAIWYQCIRNLICLTGWIVSILLHYFTGWFYACVGIWLRYWHKSL